jgi:hypothetical protein
MSALKDFLNKPINDFIPNKQTRTIKKVLRSPYLTEQQKNRIKQNLTNAGIKIEEKYTFIDYLKDNPKELWGLVILIAIGIAMLLVSWIAAAVWIVIIATLMFAFSGSHYGSRD